MINSIKINLKNVIKKGTFEDSHLNFIFSMLNKLQQFKKYENKIIKLKKMKLKIYFYIKII